MGGNGRRRDERERQQTSVRVAKEAVLMKLINYLVSSLFALHSRRIRILFRFFRFRHGRVLAVASRPSRAFLFSLRLGIGFFQSRRMDDCRTDGLGLYIDGRPDSAGGDSPARKHRRYSASADLRRSDFAFYSGRIGTGRRIHREVVETE
jgi:hypothetical protein